MDTLLTLDQTEIDSLNWGIVSQLACISIQFIEHTFGRFPWNLKTLLKRPDCTANFIKRHWELYSDKVDMMIHSNLSADEILELFPKADVRAVITHRPASTAFIIKHIQHITHTTWPKILRRALQPKSLLRHVIQLKIPDGSIRYVVNPNLTNRKLKHLGEMFDVTGLIPDFVRNKGEYTFFDAPPVPARQIANLRQLDICKLNLLHDSSIPLKNYTLEYLLMLPGRNRTEVTCCTECASRFALTPPDLILTYWNLQASKLLYLRSCIAIKKHFKIDAEMFFSGYVSEYCHIPGVWIRQHDELPGYVRIVGEDAHHVSEAGYA